MSWNLVLMLLLAGQALLAATGVTLAAAQDLQQVALQVAGG